MPPSSCPAPFAGSLRSGVSPARRRPAKRKATRARSVVRRKDAQAEGEGRGPFGSHRLPSPPERAKRRYRTSWAKVGTHESKNELPPPNLFGLQPTRLIGRKTWPRPGLLAAEQFDQGSFALPPADSFPATFGHSLSRPG